MMIVMLIIINVDVNNNVDVNDDLDNDNVDNNNVDNDNVNNDSADNDSVDNDSVDNDSVDNDNVDANNNVDNDNVDNDKVLFETEIKDKINKKIGLINELNKVLSEVYIKVTNKVKPIYESMYELQDEIYNDPWLRLVELNKIKDTLDDALNFVTKEIYGQKMAPKIINIDKNKDIDGYVDKLTDIINNYIKLINKIVETMAILYVI